MLKTGCVNNAAYRDLLITRVKNSIWVIHGTVVSAGVKDPELVHKACESVYERGCEPEEYSSGGVGGSEYERCSSVIRPSGRSPSARDEVKRAIECVRLTEGYLRHMQPIYREKGGDIGSFSEMRLGRNSGTERDGDRDMEYW